MSFRAELNRSFATQSQDDLPVIVQNNATLNNSGRTLMIVYTIQYQLAPTESAFVQGLIGIDNTALIDVFTDEKNATALDPLNTTQTVILIIPNAYWYRLSLSDPLLITVLSEVKFTL